MDNNFTTLLPFIMAGVLIGFYFPAGGPSAGRRPPSSSPPSASSSGGNSRSPGIPNNGVGSSRPASNGIVTLRDTVRAPSALSTTSLGSESSPAHATRAPTVLVDARATLFSAARAHGWSELDGITMDALTLLGTLRGFNAGSVTQDENVYLTRFVSYVLLGVLFRHQGSTVTDGVLRDIAANFARTGRFDLGAIPSASSHLFGNDEALANFVTTTTTTIVNLALALVHRVDESPEVSWAFHQFAQNPSSWSRYIFNVEVIVRLLHHSRGPSFRTLTVALPSSNSRRGGAAASSFVTSIVGFFNAHFLGHGGGMGMGIEVEAGIGGMALSDSDVEYLASLFVASLLRFHARDIGGAPAKF